MTTSENINTPLKLYRFYFSEIEKPILIEAYNKMSARIKLQEIMPEIEERGYLLEDLVRETVEELVDGVSFKLIKGQKHIWQNKRWQLANR